MNTKIFVFALCSVLALLLVLFLPAVAQRHGLQNTAVGGNLIFLPDDTYDIGASGATRPKALYVGTGGITIAGGTITQSSGSFISSGVIRLGDIQTVQWGSARSRIASPVDGQLVLYNAAQNNFSLLQFGGTTNAFAAIKRAGNTVAVRRADDTVGAFADLTACGAALEGAIAPISDSNTNVWGAAAAGGGANHVLVYCNGTSWTVAAK